MKLRGLMTATLLLTIIGGVLWWSNRKEARASKTIDETKSTKLFTVPDDQIQEIKLQKQGADTIDLHRTAGKWQIVSPKSLPADQDSVSSMLSTLSSMNSDHVIEEHATNVDQYGLSQPSMKVTIVETNSKSHELLVGDSTPAGSAAYAELAGEPKVFTIASYMKTSLDKSPNDLRDKRFLTFETDKVTRLELTAKKQTLEFGRNKEQWQIVKPKPFRADQFPVEELLRNLHDAKMDLGSSDDEKKVAAAFNAGTPVATAKVTDASGTQELQVRKNKDDYYAKSSAVAGIYKVSASVGTGLDKSLDDFRNKKLFDFGYSDPEKVEIHDASKSYSLSKSPADSKGSSDWLSNGAKMEESGVRTLIDKIRDLSASKFVDSGFTSSALDIAVTSDGGKRQEKLLISKNGDRYIAQRENEPALYELDASAVTDLQKAASDLKPVPPPKPAASPTPPKK
jgi:Domain of unknown function (DUF4340)